MPMRVACVLLGRSAGWRSLRYGGCRFLYAVAGRVARVGGRLHRQDARVGTHARVAALAVSAIYYPV